MSQSERIYSVAFVGAVLTLSAFAWIAHDEIGRLQDATQWTLHTREVLATIDRIGQLVSEAESNARGYAVAGSARLEEAHRSAVAELPGLARNLAALVQDNPEQQRHAQALSPLLQEKVAHTEQVVAARRTQGEAAAFALIRSGAGMEAMQRVRESLAALSAVESSLLQARTTVEAQRGRATRQALAFLTAAALVLLAVAWVSCTRTLRRLRVEQAKAAHGEARLRATLKSCGDAVIVTDNAGLVTLINPVAEGLTGWRRDQAHGVPVDQVFRIVNEFSRDTVESPVSRVLREGNVVGLANHTLLIARDGKETPIDDSGAPIRAEDGEVVGVVLVFRDVSARKLSEQSHDRMVRAEAERSAAVAANQAKDQFLAVLSHELRGPLAAIRGWLQVLMRTSPSPDELRLALERIFRSTRIQERVINDLLDVSRIIAGKFEVVTGPLDLLALMRRAVEECRPAAEQRGVNLILTDAPTERYLVNGDEERLAQAIGNIVGNAVKFTPSGGSVTVTASVADGNVSMRVQDTGIGMTPDVMEHLFERFWQADSTKTRQQGGLGLGLAITRYIVDQHEGSIRAYSEGPGRGSLFEVELPLLDTRMAEAQPSPEAGRETDLHGLSVLVVDDATDMQEPLVVYLRMLGATVSTASSTKEALERYESERPAVIITDIGMPNEDGYALAINVRERDAAAGRRTRIVAVSGFAEAEAASTGARFDSYFTKPVDMDKLADTIRALA